MSEAAVVPIEILLVEDDPGDAYLTVLALQQSKLQNTINVVNDGEQAMARLRLEPPYQQTRRPDLILLDLNLPRKSGLEVLAEVKQDPLLQTIPVVVLTTSNRAEDIQGAYDLHANAYVSKPVELDHFLQAIRALDEFFLAVVRRPET